MNAAVDQWYESWLSSARFGTFVAAAQGDRKLAVELVDWDREMRGELLKELGGWEIALRNRYDDVLTSWWTGPEHWLLDPSGPVQRRMIQGGEDINRRLRESIAKSLRRAGANAHTDKVVAGMSLDFWRYLTITSREKSLWVPALHRAFPRGADRMKVDRQIDGLYKLRNRIAHHQPIFDKKIPQLIVDLILSCEVLRPELAAVMEQRATVINLWKQHPAP